MDQALDLVGFDRNRIQRKVSCEGEGVFGLDLGAGVVLELV